VGDSGSVYGVAFNPDGKTLASGHADGSILLWDLSTHKILGQPLIGHSSRVTAIVFSSDGQTLFSSGNESNIIMWDVPTHQAIGQPLADHTGSIISIAFNPASQTLISGGVDDTIRIWDLDPQAWIDQTCRRIGRNFTQTEWMQYFADQPSYPYDDLTCQQWPAGN
jgi:WD40 repeat protein